MSQKIAFRYDDALLREIKFRNLSMSTFKNYRSHLSKLENHWQKNVATISVEECSEYLYFLFFDRGLGGSSVNVCRAAYIFFQNAVLKQPVNLLALPKQKLTTRFPDILSSEQIFLILNSLSLKHKTILALCYGSGLRISEALALHVSDVDSKQMKLFVRCGKGRKPRYTILSTHSLNLLREYYKKFRPGSSWLFPNKDGSKHQAPQNTQNVFSRMFKKLNPYSEKKITTHTLRHCFATHLLDSGTDIRTIQALLGHKSIKSTCLYLHLTDHHFSQLVSPADSGTR
jgi:site-specific recombinase XerD